MSSPVRLGSGLVFPACSPRSSGAGGIDWTAVEEKILRVRSHSTLAFVHAYQRLYALIGHRSIVTRHSLHNAMVSDRGLLRLLGETTAVTVDMEARAATGVP